MPGWEAIPSPPEAVTDREKGYLDASPHFGSAEARRYIWPVTYSAREFVTFLGTTSNFRMLDEESRRRLLERIERRINAEHGGTVRKEFLGTLAVARPAA